MTYDPKAFGQWNISPSKDFGWRNVRVPKSDWDRIIRHWCLGRKSKARSKATAKQLKASK